MERERGREFVRKKDKEEGVDKKSDEESEKEEKERG